ncbi:serine/arginine repetitive matrix protein 3-like, partial [Nomascus leucogenys]|uniref:serine/arginine repetitive matrix protein 3-like n=1 Tax=Nomascus leucogenys TaxID=61853 RepID=UPI00122DB7C6
KQGGKSHRGSVLTPECPITRPSRETPQKPQPCTLATQPHTEKYWRTPASNARPTAGGRRPVTRPRGREITANRDAALSSHRHPGCAQRPRPPTFASSSQRRSVFRFDDGNFPGLGERSHAPGSRLGSPTLGRDAEPEPPAGSEATGEWGGCPVGLGGDAVTPGPRNEHSPSRSPAPASRDATLRVMTSCARPAHSSSRRPGPRPAPRDDVSIHSTRSG